jgi:hypothetical protein
VGTGENRYVLKQTNLPHYEYEKTFPRRITADAVGLYAAGTGIR